MPILTFEAPATKRNPDTPPFVDTTAFDNDSHDDGAPVTERDIRVIAASLHDQGKSHVLPNMIEQVSGERPPDEDFSPRKLRIRDPEWNGARHGVTRINKNVGRI